jgi:hypothetical protein
VCRRPALPSPMLTDKEAEEIRRGLAVGMRGPVPLKWCGQLLADRDERVARKGLCSTLSQRNSKEPATE